MKEILDDDFFQMEIDRSELVSNPFLKGLAYFLIMLLFGMMFSYFVKQGTSTGQKIIESIFFMILPALLSSIINIFRHYFYLKREEKSNRRIARNPYSFYVIKTMFIIWIIMVSVLFIGRFF